MISINESRDRGGEQERDEYSYENADKWLGLLLNDPNAAKAQLFKRSLQDPNLAEFNDENKEPSADGRRAAYFLASDLGDCRAYAVDLKEMDGTLPPNMALAAAKELCERAEGEAERIKKLEIETDDDPIKADEKCCSFVESRINLWFAQLAILESSQGARKDKSPLAKELDGFLKEIEERLAELDKKIKERMDIIGPQVMGTRLIKNMRNGLDPSLKKIYPWILNGTFEELADKEK